MKRFITKTRLLGLLVCFLPLSVSAAAKPQVELLCKERNSGENSLILMPLEDGKYTGVNSNEGCFYTDTVDENTLKTLTACHFEYETGGKNYTNEYTVNRKTGEMTMKYFETDTGVYVEHKLDCQKAENKF